MRTPSRVRSLCSVSSLACLLAFIVCPAARADDAVGDFNVFSNVAGSRWTYGITPSLGGTFTLLPTAYTDPGNRRGWRNGANDMVMQNGNAFDVNVGGVNVPAGAVTIEPKTLGSFVVVRWLAPSSGTATIVARFLRHSTATQQPSQIAILHSGVTLFSRWLVRDVSPVASASIVLTVAAGEVIDFVAGTGDLNATGDIVGLDATVNLEPYVNPAGPVVTFAGQRFVPCFGDSAAESIAFDPVNRRIASNGAIRNVCGAPFSPGPDLAPGLAWDPRTLTYWQITNARVVRQWSAAGVLIGNLFTLPATFTVPGWGVDTLDAPKGIAVDSNFVYVVDAGPMSVQGQIHANEWFKFSRTGTPVKSSKLTDFHANLDLSPDALVDDIVYVPFAAPFLKGKLIISLEHSGIQVIDTDGNFVSKFRWTDVGVPPGIRISGFAGITIDPLTGNLYLVENSGGMTQIWTRLPTSSATYYAVGTGSGPARLHLPAVGCNRPLWKDLPSEAGLVFGCSYRTINQTIYGVDYGSSQLYRFYAGSGDGGRVGLTGSFGQWGFAYDTERDVFYGEISFGGNGRVVAIDPATCAVDPRPNTMGFDVRDMAFDPVDHKLYGVAGTQLIRIDRDTGVGTLVGTTAGVSGLDYDALSNRLIAIQNSGPAGSATMWSIDPATGASSTITTVPTNQAWEGLAVVPVPATGTVSVDAPSVNAAVFLVASPNPTRRGVGLSFTLPLAARIEAGIFDVQGRRVRALASGWKAAGPHGLSWDGLDDGGRNTASGVYFARVEYGTRSLIARFVKVE